MVGHTELCPIDKPLGLKVNTIHHERIGATMKKINKGKAKERKDVDKAKTLERKSKRANKYRFCYQ